MSNDYEGFLMENLRPRLDGPSWITIPSHGAICTYVQEL
jgi:hypothetical protein